ncbi:MAG: energy transducer TonB [Proteobacteria bacterium]|nr:energy transducer TonB [Pseudomonadota bacterium]
MSVAETVASRGTVGAGILVAHVALVAVLASAGVIRTSPIAPPVSVTFLQQEEKRAERPPVDQPVLTPVHQVLIPPPDVVVEIEPGSTAIAASAADTPPPPPPSAPASGSATIPEISDVAYLVQPAPRYPPESRRIREQGLVMLRVLIDERGHAKAVEIYKSSGHPRLDEAARAAVTRAVFKPYIDGGIARAAAAIVPVEFSLRAAS